MKTKDIIVGLVMLLGATAAKAQIMIGGNIYGGGNAGDTDGNTQVNIYQGDLGRVFGGAALADVGGHAYVNIDGAHASSYIVIDQVYGGNDMSGTIGSNLSETSPQPFTPEVNTVNGSWSAYVRITSNPVAANNQKIYIGQLFGGGNGDYTYDSATEGGKTYHILKDQSGNEIYRTLEDLNAPDMGKTYLELLGGSIVNVFGGGNKATLTESVVIHLNNPSEVVNHIYVIDGEEVSAGTTGAVDLLTEDRFVKMGFNYKFTFPNSGAYQIGNLFGGNNKVDMAIRPTWSLVDGDVRNLYSGGNEGRMTSPEGLLLQIPENSTVVVDNVYGGCRRADVRPIKDGSDVANGSIQLVSNPDGIPAGFAARTRILGGHVNNVYGGNDVSGNVYGGSTVGIFTTIYGSVYGGGNGSYAYTDNVKLKDDMLWRDFYYDPSAYKGRTAGGTFTQAESVEALNAIRPNTEQVSVLVKGRDDTHRVFVEDAVYLGGNSASIRGITPTNQLVGSTRKVELKIGSYVTIDKVFLGNNGENMIKYNEEETTDGSLTKREGVLLTFARSDIASDHSKFNSMDLSDANIFAKYMDGCAMHEKPSVVFEGFSSNTGDPIPYEPYTSFFGSFYCGGNVGSMIYEGKNNITFNHAVIIYDKFVGGCNNANVPEQKTTVNGVADTKVNAAYSGGILGTSNEVNYTVDGTAGGAIKDRLELDLSGLKIRPMRWKVERDGDYKIIYRNDDNEVVADPANGHVTYLLENDQQQLEWNTIQGDGDDIVEVAAGTGTGTATTNDQKRRFQGGNIYGGCYSSGHVNGNVVINIDGTIHEKDILFDQVVAVTEKGDATDRLYDIKDAYEITERRSGVALHTQGMDPLGQALNVFGGGKGEDTEIWGSATVNLNDGFTFQIFGGSEEGVIGKKENIKYKTEGGKQVVDIENSTYDARYSTRVNLKDADMAGAATSSDNLAEAVFIYGGGFEGPIVGNSYVYLDNGRLFNSFTGSCDADILGHTETYVGQTGFPYVIDHIYGANDLGGTIFGKGDFTAKVASGTLPLIYNSPVNMLEASSYMEYRKGHVDWIFGGCYGDYDYDVEYPDKTPPYEESTFVHFRPVVTSNTLNGVNRIFGAGQGHKCVDHDYSVEKDKMQNRSYVLIDIPDGVSTSTFENMAVFGAGANCGVGMKTLVDPASATAAQLDGASAVIDLIHGKIGNAYGGSFAQGFTRRTVVNVPKAQVLDGWVKSTININNIFGGAYGEDPLKPCDVYEARVNYHSDAATVRNNIYGGNNHANRTLYGFVNVSVPVYNGITNPNNPSERYLAKVFGAGYGVDSWSQYTRVNLMRGAQVDRVYGGGEKGKVINRESLLKWQKNVYAVESAKGPDVEKNYLDLSMDLYEENGLENHLVVLEEIDDRDYTGISDGEKAKRYRKYNSNVIINEGATVENYAYGAGLGDIDIPNSGEVLGSSYIALLGGTVKKDIYAAGTTGAVYDYYDVKTGFDNNLEADGQTTKTSVSIPGFKASTTAFIKGGTARNVYGGGWEGPVGRHVGVKKSRTVDGKEQKYMDYFHDTSTTNDIAGETHVVIGKLDGTSFTNGIPAIERNAYGGGEGGPVFGTTNITLNRGYIGYRHFYNSNYLEKDVDDNTKTISYITDHGSFYQEKINDETYYNKEGVWLGKNSLYDSGCIFGGGYIDNSNVDITNVKMYGGHVRNALFGGGEIAAIGRGIINASGEHNSVRELRGIYKAGKTNVTLFEGHVHRNVFGGGRGYNNLGEGGTLYSDGYVFGQTEVNIHGGEIGTEAGLDKGFGNVFGGGDIGYVYSAYENADGDLCFGKKSGKRYDTSEDDLTLGDEGYYYEHEGGHYALNNGKYEIVGGNFKIDNGEKVLTEDCKVLIEPKCRVNDIQFLKDIKQTVDDEEVTLYAAGKSVSQEQFNAIPEDVLNTLTQNTDWKYIDPVTIGSKTLGRGKYFDISDLNKLKNKNDYDDVNKTGDKLIWDCLDDFGIVIYNAVFAGGNTSSGSASVYANATTIFGNATASIHDVYHRDLITLGTGHTGGLYGDGNLTFVDGYRGLNITNYGTDYYSIDNEIDIDQYHALPDREAAYYELKYKCVRECTDNEHTTYYPADPSNPNSKASTLTADDILTLFKNTTLEHFFNDDGTINTDTENGAYWVENGVLPVYAGRLMNTIQRADFCGVFGSRMVMQGAQDRVPEIVDYTNYTINRVREVSLNKKTSEAGDGGEHGNYFGIYNIVNYLGALTSDVDFGCENADTGGQGAIRTTDNDKNPIYKQSADGTTYGKATFYDWKKAYWNDRRRNNGNSHNKVALASGVYLELTTEESTGNDLYEKDWGYITGVIELDLINVQTGLGGGFVYARNVHGQRTLTNLRHTSLTALNATAISNKMFRYNPVDNDKVEYQTSGNFVHSTQTIIDDCYNISGKYKSGYNKPDGVPAHYWYIKGSVYVYDQYISAYTGAPNAYSEVVEIPLTITAASHGTMKLLDVRPNLYAYKKANGQPMDADGKIVINDVTYYKNDPISYWDWYLMTTSEKELFVNDTYVVIADCKIGATEYKEGTVMDHSAYLALRGADLPAESYTTVTYTVTNPTTGAVTTMSDKPFDYFFRSSNNLGHDTGYILTYRVDNPSCWDTWYTQVNPEDEGPDRMSTSAYNKEAGYEDGPTYRLTGSSELLGQRRYEVTNIISKEVYDTYQAAATAHPEAVPANPAEFEPAWIVTDAITLTDGILNRGTALPASQVLTDPANPATVKATYSGKVEQAYVCTHTIQLGPTEYIYQGDKMTPSEKNAYKARFAPTIEGESNPNANADLVDDIEDFVVPAYYCKTAGLYGGNYYESGKNYRGLEAWSSMSETDRTKFTFNYDAFDLLINKDYDGSQGHKYKYDSEAGTWEAAQANPAGYSLEKPVDYTASYLGDDNLPTSEITVKRVVDVEGTPTVQNISTTSIQKDDELDRETYESLPNEQRHYSVVDVKETGDSNPYYVVNTAFQIGSTPYAVGETISREAYNTLGDERVNITKLIFGSDCENQLFYYCRDSYTVSNDENGKKVTAANGVTAKNSNDDVVTVGGEYDKNTTVPQGLVISADNYSGPVNGLVNKQKDFTIHGIAPTETSTLYVSRNSDIFDLSSEKIITVIYQYDYEESDASGNITPVSERHVVNIHIQFKSGVPDVEDIRKPQIILPGSKLGMREPNVTPGAYEVTGGGWEIFQSVTDAESHVNGVEYRPVEDKLYWYQNDYWVAYYAQTYLGKTYSNHVQLSVANYHDLANVMADKEHHYYIDHRDVDREPKIYINDYSSSGQNGLDLFRDIIDLSHHTLTYGGDGKPIAISGGTLDGHVPLDNSHEGKRMRGGDYLEFFLRSNQDHSGSSWTPVANGDNECFNGRLHGDGYTISGLDKSLFNHLCGDVYNLGVTGTFTSAGIAETGEGYMENCWIYTTSEAAKTSKPVFGTPTIISGDESTRPYRIINCYYLEDKDATYPYEPHSGSYGIPVRKPEQSFYNGEVTYNLNGFYLNKRFYDSGSSEANTALSGYTTSYNYYRADADGAVSTNAETGEYNVSPARYPATIPAQYGNIGYVESRFGDGDFIYAGGTIPETKDARTHTDNEGNIHYYPIWPDDYLFFGQVLSYGHEATRTHQPLPTYINRSGNRLTKESSSINRVYRAPAYFRNKVMGIAHYNPFAIFAAKSADESHTVYPNMTAIDFTGGNGDLSSGYKRGLNGDKFYPPLIDNDGLTLFRNVDLTQNLLVYTPEATDIPTDAASKTNSAVNAALTEPAYAETHNSYHTVDAQDASGIYGHPIEKVGSSYKALLDHFLVDKQDFNAPISYTFNTGKRMWYQRMPEKYAGQKKDGEGNLTFDSGAGWEGVSLPFTAELVTTDQKGEITHFYSGSHDYYESDVAKTDDKKTKVGHEYWLREFTGIDAEHSTNTEAKAFMNYPEAITPGEAKTVESTFLWDYYYNETTEPHHKDANEDTYQTYYNSSRTYNGYPRLANAKPYIIGFPGQYFYEFDLSGKFGDFKQLKTYPPQPAQLKAQTITFASNTGATIGVSDDELVGVKPDGSAYTFVPSYLNETLKSVELKDVSTAAKSYALNDDGSAYVAVTRANDAAEGVGDVSALPFRPYFTSPAGTSPARETRSIAFSKELSQLKGVDEHNDPNKEKEYGTLKIYPDHKKIIVESSLSYTTDVYILTPAGMTVSTFSIEPGETIETTIINSGVYIVTTEDRNYIKKLSVK